MTNLPAISAVCVLGLTGPLLVAQIEEVQFASVTVRLAEAASGTPLEDARVSLIANRQLINPPPFRIYSESRVRRKGLPPVRRLQLEELVPGTYSATDLFPGVYVLNAEQAWPYTYHLQRIELLPGSSLEVTIALQKSVSLYGWITDSEGRPLPGMTIQAVCTDPDTVELIEQISAAQDSKAETSEQGWFWLGDNILPNRPFVLEFTGGGLSTWISTPMTGSDGEWIRADTTVDPGPGRTLHGVVTTVDGAPVQAATVQLFRSGLLSATERALWAVDTIGARREQVRKATTDTAGRYRFGGLHGGTYRVVGRKRGSGRISLEIRLQEKVTEVGLTLNPGQ